MSDMVTKGRTIQKRQDMSSRLKENLVAIGIMLLIMMWILVVKQ